MDDFPHAVAAGGSAAAGVSRRARAALTLACVAAATLAAGCATESSHRDADLAQIGLWLPGRYDNQAQIATDRREGRPAHAALALAVVPVDAVQVGHHVFYIEESAGRAEAPGTPRLILAQRLASIDVLNGKITAALYSFTDPARWRDGASTPELFSSLQPQDVKLMQGCELIWTAGAAEFTATDDAGACQISSPVTGGVEPMRIRVKLTQDEIDVTAEPAAAGTATDTPIRFRRSGGS